MVAIRIAPKTPVTVLIYKICLMISSVLTGMLFRETVGQKLAVNSAVERMVVDTVITAHAGDLDVAEDRIFQKLILIGLTPVVEYLFSEDAVHRMALALNENRIEF